MGWEDEIRFGRAPCYLYLAEKGTFLSPPGLYYYEHGGGSMDAEAFSVEH